MAAKHIQAIPVKVGKPFKEIAAVGDSLNAKKQIAKKLGIGLPHALSKTS